MKPTPELRRARLTASAVKGLTVKPGADGRLLWYWEPNRAEKAAGWKPLKFGEDRKAAQAGSEARNIEVAAWRRGDDPVPPRTGEGDHVVVEGHRQVIPTSRGTDYRVCPSTTFGGPPPPRGRNL